MYMYLLTELLQVVVGLGLFYGIHKLVMAYLYRKYGLTKGKK